ncbi:netrin-like protein [Dinothrombium tinctorium]|uniref:Netrin-like protein n=1 Tax=Dinothrombium tinctorium TaxID=1965070 RepID=A0A3S3Q662_9ACAR|nr:netrin-like protein [Dinothrombium tinctorium]
MMKIKDTFAFIVEIFVALFARTLCLMLFFTLFFCPLLSSAIEANVVSRETVGEWIRFTIQVVQIYKHGPSRIHHGTEYLWVPLVDLACKCPKMRVKNTYLFLGTEERNSEPRGMIVDRSGVAIEWKEEWGRRMLRYQRRQRSGKCKEI